MESILVSSAPRVRVSASPFAPVVASTRNLSPICSMRGGARRVAPLRCTKPNEVPLDRSTMLAYSDFSNSVEVKEWESGKSINDIAAKQGIRIRRCFQTQHPSKDSGGEKLIPRNILEQIIWDKEIEVAQFKREKPLDTLKKSINEAPPVRDFLGALRESYKRNSVPALIAEVKKASPSKGVLREDFDPVQIAKTYEKNGAACLSILTDEKYFQGSFTYLEAVRKSGVKCPLLCKEFIIDPWQIYNARLKGADAVLLIAGVLLDIDIKYLTMICSELGLTALVEVHDEREFDRVLQIDGVQLIGINNRNLETFEVDIANTEKLLEGERGIATQAKGIMVVGESGLFTPEDISFVQNAGVRAVLVGESLLKQSDPGKAVAGLFGKDIS